MTTFQLDKLSAELILAILEFIGPEFFRQDVGRFALSKRWYAITWPFYIRHLELTNRSLVSLVDMSTSIAPHQHPSNTRILKDIRNTTQSVTFLIEGLAKEPYETRYWDWEREPGWGRVTNGSQTPSYRVAAWKFQLEEAIKKVGFLLGASSLGVKSLKLFASQRSRNEASPPIGLARWPWGQTFLDVKTVMHSVIQYADLKELEIDFPPDHMLGTQGFPGETKGTHLCPVVRGRLPGLRRLWIRLPEACFCLFESRAKGEHMLGTDELSPFGRLESVVVVLSYDPALVRPDGDGSGNPVEPKNYHSRKCPCEHKLHRGHGAAQMCFAMWRLGRRMRAGLQTMGRGGKRRVARLLWRTRKTSPKKVHDGRDQGYELVSFDGMTGKLMVLEGTNPAWDAEGEERLPDTGDHDMRCCFEDMFDARSGWIKMLSESPSSASSEVENNTGAPMPETWPHLDSVIRASEAKPNWCPRLVSGDSFTWNWSVYMI